MVTEYVYTYICCSILMLRGYKHECPEANQLAEIIRDQTHRSNDTNRQCQRMWRIPSRQDPHRRTLPTPMFVYMYICMYVHRYMYTCIHMLAHACIYIYVYIYICIYIYIYVRLLLGYEFLQARVSRCQPDSRTHRIPDQTRETAPTGNGNGAGEIRLDRNCATAESLCGGAVPIETVFAPSAVVVYGCSCSCLVCL